MIRIRHATKRYGDTAVVDDVCVDLPRGGVTSIVGPNGAGKSTLLGMASRLVSMDAGTITVDDMDVTSTPSDVLARHLAILRQDNHLAIRLTIRELVEFGRFPHSRGRLRATDHRHVDAAIERMGLADLAHRHLDELSGGQRQAAFVAMVLAQDTDYVLLDEPLNNLDIHHAAEMMHTLGAMATDLGKTVVVVMHDINVASVHSDHIVALRGGRVVHTGSPAEVVTDAALADVFDVPARVHELDGHRISVHYTLDPVQPAHQPSTELP